MYCLKVSRSRKILGVHQSGIRKQNMKHPNSSISSYIHTIQISISDVTLINIRMSVKIGVKNMLLLDNIYCKFYLCALNTAGGLLMWEQNW
jgi:hypothetical protein